MANINIATKPIISAADTDYVLVASGNNVKRTPVSFVRGLAGAPGAVERAGAGVPSNALGIDGDWYTNTTNGDKYMRVAGAYALQLNIKGANGLSAYQVAVANGYGSNEATWLTSLQGASAYAVAVANGFAGSAAEWLVSLQGPPGLPGDSAGTFSLNTGGAAPELAQAPIGGSFTFGAGTGTAPTQDASGILWSAGGNSSTASFGAITKDNTTYDCSITIASYTSGGVKLQVYGDTTAHLGTGPTLSANGTFTFQVSTSGAGSLTDQIRLQATGASGTNSFRITALSVKEAGAGTYPSRSMTAKVKEVQISVIDFGADKTGVADSTAAFVAAIAYGSRRVYVPEGVYKVTNLVVDRTIEIFGDGREQSIIQVTGNGAVHGMKVIGETALGRTNLIKLRDFQLRYTGAGQTSGATGVAGVNNWSGIYLQRKVLMQNVYVRDFTNDGIYYAASDTNEASAGASPGSVDETVFFSRMDNVWSKDNGRDGIWVRYGANANSFINCQFDRNGRYGFHHSTNGQPTYGNTIRDGQCSYNKYWGYYFENGTNIVTSGLYAEFNCSPDNTNTNGYTQTALNSTERRYDFYTGDNCVRSWIGIGVLLSQDTTHSRVPGFNSNTIQIWEGGRKLFGDT